MYLVAFYLLLLVMPIVLHIRQEKHADCVAKRKKNLEGVDCEVNEFFRVFALMPLASMASACGVASSP